MSRVARMIPPPLAARVWITWSDDSSAGWDVTDGYADALFETIARDLGKPTKVFNDLKEPV